MKSSQVTQLAVALLATFSLMVGCTKIEDEPAMRQTSIRENVAETSTPREVLSAVDSVDTDQAKTASTPVSTSAIDPLSESAWGNFHGRFIYDGLAPARRKLTVTKDTHQCTKHHPLDDSLIVNGENGGLANVVVCLYLKRGSDTPPVHPSYEETAHDKVTLDNEFCRFEPHVALLRTSQTLRIRNRDAVGHNTKIDMYANPSINPIIPAGGSLDQQFTAPERGPARVSCSIHPWMSGFIVVTDHPYIATTAEDGTFEIKNLPTGEWTFQAWHEKPRYIQKVTLNGKETNWKRGRFTITIEPGENDLGEINVSPKLFD